uniref:Uncharacterized protein n=1 Tax=Anguilla anguilla TaxID=7936 RepID=A0A0E9P8J1_ANGAN
MRRRKLKRRLFCPLDSCTKGWCCFFPASRSLFQWGSYGKAGPPSL